MKKILLFFAVITTVSVNAGDLSKVVKVTDLNIETEKAVKANRSYYVPDNEKPAGYLNLNLKLSIKDLAYVHQQVESTITNSQFRNVGYRVEVGAEVVNGIDLYVRHFSTHSLDYNPNRDFHQENAIGIRWNFIRKK